MDQATKKESRDVRDTKYFIVSTTVIRIILGTLFAVSGIAKLFDLYHFQLTVASFDILPLSIVPVFSYALPFAEILVGVPMLLGFKTKRAALGIMMLLGLFIVALAINLFQTWRGHCGCTEFGISEGRGWQVIILDVILLLLCVQVYFDKKHAWSLDNTLKK